MAEHNRVARPAGIVAFFTFLSRILGLVRDMVVAFCFGSGLAADAFFVAFRIPNMLRRLVAEGALIASFLPVYVDYLENREPQEAQRVVNIIFTLLTLILIGIALLGILLSPWIIKLFAPGFLEYPEKFNLAVALNRILFPYIFFVSLVALCMGVLNAKGHFAAPAAAPILLNVFMISGALVFSRWIHPPIYGLAIGVLIGGLFQLLLQLPALAGKKVIIRPCFSLRDPAVNRIGRLFFPAAFGAAVYQLNILVSNILASFLPGGSISYLWYASRLLEFPLGVFGVALATAAFPSLSQQSSRKDTVVFKKILEDTMRLVTFITLPAMVGLIMIREPIVQILFQRGAFDASTTLQTANALLYYSLGMWAIAASRIFVSGFHSLQDTITPVKVSIIVFIANVIFSLLLMGPMKHCGLALANSLSAMLNIVMLLFCFHRRLGIWGLAWVKDTGIKVSFASLGMGLCLWGLIPVVGRLEEGQIFENCVRLGFLIGTGIVVYALLCFAANVKELKIVTNLLKSKFFRK